MTRINRLFLLLVIVGPLHMAEQLLTSIEESNLLASYYAWLAPASADAATVILITVVAEDALLVGTGIEHQRARRPDHRDQNDCGRIG